MRIWASVAEKLFDLTIIQQWYTMIHSTMLQNYKYYKYEYRDTLARS